jgi:hypothetical protein
MYIQANEKGIKEVPATHSWRLIHNNGKVMDLVESSNKGEAGGTTEIFVAATKAECEAEILRLDLELPEHLQANEEA